MKYKGGISIGLVNCQKEFEYEIPDEDLAEMTETEVSKEISDWVIANEIDFWFEEVPNEE